METTPSGRTLTREQDDPLPAARLLAAAIVQTLVYADLFDYPLTAPEIARYLIGYRADPAAVAHELATNPELRACVEQHNGFYYLAGRADLPEIRARRAATAARLWRRAARWTRLLRHCPFVEMIAVTGALAVDNVGAVPDIDLLLVCTPGRVWIARRLVVCAVRTIRLWGDEICPNFLLAADSLALAQQDLFTAHELAQMRPVAGYPVYNAMLAANPWMGRYLPNARPLPAPARPRPARSALQRLGERVLRSPWFDGWERWEMARMQRALGVPHGADDEIACTPQQCKGHTGRYRRQVLERFATRLAGVAHPAGGSGNGA
jgi:hypothetical protein